VLLLAMVGAAYLPGVWDAGFVWDDDHYVSDNRDLRDADGLRRIWLEPTSSPQYYPLVFTSLWVERQLFGEGPRCHHVVNVLLHGLGTLLLWLVLRRLRVPGAWLGAALFALHPVQVESVAWITERKNVLSTLLYLGAALAYLRFALHSSSVEEAAPRRGLGYAIALLLFLGALLSKTVTATLPAALLLVLWWRRGTLRPRRDLLPLVPFFALGIVLALHTLHLEATHVGATGADWALGPADRWVLSGRVIGFYLLKLAWPADLSFVYPRWPVDATVWWQHLFPLAVVALLGSLWLLRARLGRGPLVALLFFCGSLLPVLGFFDVYPMRFSWVADHFQYLASIGPLALLGGGLHTVGTRFPPRLRWGWLALCGALLLTLGWLSLRQCAIYHDAETLWRTTLARSPQAWIAHNNLGLLLGRQGRDEEARRHIARAVALKPSCFQCLTNLGALQGRRGHTADAVALFREALRVEPRYAEAHLNLALALLRLGQPAEAQRHLRRTVALRPDDALAHFELGRLRMRARPPDLEAAQRHFAAAARGRPAWAQAHNNLAAVLERLGRTAAAEASYRRALVLDPGYARARKNLARLLERTGRAAEARALLERR
jgi:Flp pilus assembly protein TadD